MPPVLDVVLVDVLVENSGRVGGQIGVGGFAHPSRLVEGAGLIGLSKLDLFASFQYK